MKEKREPMSAELLEVMRSAETLATLTAEQWAVLELWHRKSIEEALDRATEIETPEDKRAGWAGRAGGLREHWQQLSDLRGGQWKQWPAVVAWQKQGGDLEEEEG